MSSSLTFDLPFVAPTQGRSVRNHMEKPQLGEFALIDWIRQRQGSQTSPWTKLGIGDDCAILRVDPGSRAPGDGRHADGRPSFPACRGRPACRRLQGAWR